MLGQYISSASSLIHTPLVWARFIQIDPNIVRLTQQLSWEIFERPGHEYHLQVARSRISLLILLNRQKYKFSMWS